jgi:hypothetical protein
VLRDDGSGTGGLLRDLVYDEQGRLRPGRLSALLQVRTDGSVACACRADTRVLQHAQQACLRTRCPDTNTHRTHMHTHTHTHPQRAHAQAALGYVSEQTDGFIDFDAVPAEGASAGEVITFLLGPEARDLRPLLAGWLAGAADLLLRDRSRKAAAALPGLLTPRLPFAALLGLPSLPSPPPPPFFVPGA